MGSFSFDLRDVLKSLRRDASYAITVILTLAFTTGATTAVFSIVNGVLLKPLAYRESHRLVAVHEIWRRDMQSQRVGRLFPTGPFRRWRSTSNTSNIGARTLLRSNRWRNTLSGR